MSITCGIDWAEAHHDVALVDHDGKVVARERIGTGVAGFAAAWSSSPSMAAARRTRR